MNDHRRQTIDEGFFYDKQNTNARRQGAVIEYYTQSPLQETLLGKRAVNKELRLTGFATY
jgi:hypothetical protein